MLFLLENIKQKFKKILGIDLHPVINPNLEKCKRRTAMYTLYFIKNVYCMNEKSAP